MVFFYAIFRSFTFVASRLPFPILYFLADFLKFILQHVLQYRKSIIRKNLSRAFPGKSAPEIQKIISSFYRNLSDIILEVIKLESVKKQKLKERFTFNGLEILQEAFDRDKSVIIAIGHCGNWEWMGTVLGMVLPVKGYAIIKPLSDKRFNHYMESLRHRFNPDSTIDFQHTFRKMVRNKKSMVTFNVFASDQTPTRSDVNYWSTFFNQDTPFYNGVEKLARSLDLTVVFMDIYRTGRGHYCGDIRMITDDAANSAENEITEKYIHYLEEAISKRPDNWLWSHRRWKFEKPPAQA